MKVRYNLCIKKVLVKNVENRYTFTWFKENLITYTIRI
jgi:hypothetical protein